MVLDDLRGGGEERLVGAPAHQRVAVVRGRGGVAHEARRHVAAPGEARVEGLKTSKKCAHIQVLRIHTGTAVGAEKPPIWTSMGSLPPPSYSLLALMLLS